MPVLPILGDEGLCSSEDVKRLVMHVVQGTGVRPLCR